MLSFKQFLNANKKRKIFSGIVVHDDNKLQESLYESYVSDDDVDHLTKQYQSLTEEQQKETKTYQGTSFPLNAKLLMAHHLNNEPIKNEINGAQGKIHNIQNFDAATNTPIGRNITVYSGLGFDPLEQIKRYGEKDLLHFPAYTSTSLNKNVALQYAGEDHYASVNENKTQKQILKLELNPEDKGIYIPGDIHNRHELVLPRNTVMRIHKSEVDPDNPDVMLHHATIEHGIRPEDMQRSPSEILKLHKNFLSHYLGSIEMTKHDNVRKILKDDLTKKLDSGDFTNDDIDHANRYGYLDKDEHIPKLKRLLSDKIDSGNWHYFDDIENAKKYKYFDENEHIPKLKSWLSKQIDSGEFNHSDINLAKNSKFFDENEHIPKLKEWFSNKIEKGVCNTEDIDIAKRYKYFDENDHIPKLKTRFYRDIENRSVNLRIIKQAIDNKYFDENEHLPKLKEWFKINELSKSGPSSWINHAKEHGYYAE